MNITEHNEFAASSGKQDRDSAHVTPREEKHAENRNRNDFAHQTDLNPGALPPGRHPGVDKRDPCRPLPPLAGFCRDASRATPRLPARSTRR